MPKLKFSSSVDAVWLTNYKVPDAHPIWATRKSRFRVKRAKAWVPKEFTIWWDTRSNTVYFAAPGEITDFASTPVGDGHKGGFRGSGRLHDLMCKDTPVLLPTTDQSKNNLMSLFESREGTDNWFTVDEIIMCGFRPARLEVSIWEAGMLYYRMLRSSGINRVRAALQRAGLRTVGAQYVYRWAWNSNPWEYESDR
jgi:hypothetical protein